MIAISNKDLRKEFVTTDLERKLKADKQGVIRDQIVDALTQWTNKVMQAKHSGLPPEEFFRAEKLLSSLRIAAQVIRRTWNGYHSSKTA